MPAGLTGSYSVPLVAVSYIVALAASNVALSLAGRVSVSRGQARGSWLAAGALEAAPGGADWSTSAASHVSSQLAPR